MYKVRKDESQLLAKWKLKIDAKFYFHVFLWSSQDSFDKNTYDNNLNESYGCVNLAPSIIEITNNGEREIIRPKLGEIHFIKDKWTLEIVAHELLHALIHRIRMIKNPDFNQIIEQVEDSEEIICYEFGRFVDEVYWLLQKENPNNFKKEET